MDSKMYKIVAGLALENDLYNGRVNERLLSLFSNPQLESIRELHGKLIDSQDHLDREAAFWLEMALELPPAKVDVADLVYEMNEMEVLLYNLLTQADANAQRDLNDWMNYIINTAQSLQDGYGIDAKIMISLALQSSKKESVERLKMTSDLRHNIELLQKETLRIFEEIKKIPLRLVISDGKFDVVIELQSIILEILQKRRSGYLEKETELIISETLNKLGASERYLMQSNPQAAKREMTVASEHLDAQSESQTDKKDATWIKTINEKIRKLLASLEE